MGLTRLAASAAPTSCRRRRRALAPVALGVVLARGEERALSPAAWTAFLALLALFAQSSTVGLFLIPSVALFAALCLIALFDARYFVIPDGPIWLLALIGAATVVASAPEEAASRLAAGAVGYAAFRTVARLYEAWRGFPGVGEGDAKLFAVAGLWLGFRGLPSCLLYGVLSALVAVVASIRHGSLESARQPIPFGPHLALGIWLVWIAGPLEIG